VLIGRAREISALEQLVESAALGRGGLGIISGEPGIGKTRLADEIARRATERAFSVSWGRAWETGGAPAYWPWIELLGPLAEGRADVPVRVSALLARSEQPLRGEGTRADPARERFELFEGVAALLRTVARSSPLLLVFDDLHAADVASLELLAFVAHGLRAARIAVVATYRDAESRQAPVAEVIARIAHEGSGCVLCPFSAGEVAELVCQDMGHSDEPLARALFKLTEGNPLFLHETLQAARASSPAEPLEALRTLNVAGGVLAVIGSRLAGAEAGLQALLEVAAVLGREGSLALLSDSSGLTASEVQRRFETALARGLLLDRGSERWAFSHVLVREAFYRELSASRRSELHRAAALALEKRVLAGAEQYLETLAHHALAALPCGEPADAVRSARRAAERARLQLAYEEANSLLERALTTCERFGLDELARAEVELALGWAATEAGRLERGRELFRSVAKRARALGNARLLARAALGQGGEYVLAEIRSELVLVLEEALALLGEPDGVEERRLRARVLARLAAALTPSATPEKPLALARQALAMTLDETDARTRIDVDVGVGAALADFAPPVERIPVNERLLRDAREVGDRVLRLRALTRLACDHLERGDSAAADAAIAARSALADSIGHPRYLWQTPLMRSMRAMPEGRFDDCMAEIAEARRIALEVSDPNAERCIEVHTFSLLLVAGRPEALRAQRPSTLRVLASLPDGLSLHTWVLAVIAARLGEREAGGEHLRTLGASSIMSARMARATLCEAALLCDVPQVYVPMYRSFSAGDALAAWGPFAFACFTPIARLLGPSPLPRGDPTRPSLIASARWH